MNRSSIHRAITERLGWAVHVQRMDRRQLPKMTMLHVEVGGRGMVGPRLRSEGVYLEGIQEG